MKDLERGFYEVADEVKEEDCCMLVVEPARKSFTQEVDHNRRDRSWRNREGHNLPGYRKDKVYG